MVLQEFIEWDQYIRCMCLGQSEVLPMKYDPRERKYHVEHEHLAPDPPIGLGVVDNEDADAVQLNCCPACLSRRRTGIDPQGDGNAENRAAADFALDWAITPVAGELG